MNWNDLLSSNRIRNTSHPDRGADLRSEFEKDYHRIIISPAFRRLQDKTQVFPLDQSDFIRTRLTHSLEASSVARSLGQIIAVQLHDPDLDEKKKADMCCILQCAGLIHDIGNPPFGHFGETTIRDWFRSNLSRITFQGHPLDQVLSRQMLQDFYHFEGNAQALRQVTKLHFLVDDHGMNLTYALLGTIIKYPVASTAVNPSSGNIKDKKMGYFLADQQIFDEIQKQIGTNGLRHPLCFILEAADDIAYLTADIEDGYKKGFLSYNKLVRELENPEVLQQLSAFEKDSYQYLLDKLKSKYAAGISRNVPDPEEYAVSNWIISVQSFLISCAAKSFIRHYQEIMNGNYYTDLFEDTAGKTIHDLLGDIAYRNVFTTQSIYKTEITAATVLDYLLEKFMSAAIRYDTNERMTDVQEKLMILISDSYKHVYERESVHKTDTEKLYLRMLLVTDYICGMTDTYAKSLYQEMNGLSL